MLQKHSTVQKNSQSALVYAFKVLSYKLNKSIQTKINQFYPYIPISCNFQFTSFEEPFNILPYKVIFICANGHNILGFCLIFKTFINLLMLI